MDSKHLLSSLFYLLFLSLFSGNGLVLVHGNPFDDLKVSKLFVFGDSYTDTGNTGKAFSYSWKIPYGWSFPGKPDGRFSDGLVLTDFFAEYLGIKSPIPYKFRRIGGKHLGHGMSFAYGGAGVFNTWFPLPNMTRQINFFQQVLKKDRVYSKRDLNSSVALVSLCGNDYFVYILRNGDPIQGWKSHITYVVNQLSLNLKRIHGLGVKKVAVTLMQPIGCLPMNSIHYSFQKCNETQNSYVTFHNHLLLQAVAKLNKQTKDSPFVILDLNRAFKTVFANKGSSKFVDILKPCCLGIRPEFPCGYVDPKGVKKYTICENPESTFFWDFGHPTQAAWHAVYLALRQQF
ncbi:hypothetical protein QYF36_016376 [Acer negundo]|nr:hypothetical protein QYF36_016376 [Acer negundo]